MIYGKFTRRSKRKGRLFSTIVSALLIVNLFMMGIVSAEETSPENTTAEVTTAEATTAELSTSIEMTTFAELTSLFATTEEETSQITSSEEQTSVSEPQTTMTEPQTSQQEPQTTMTEPQTSQEETTTVPGTTEELTTEGQTSVSYPEFAVEKVVDEITLRISAPAGTFPQGAELEIKRLHEDTDEYAVAKAALDENEVSYDGFVGFDISFYYNGEKIEPKDNAVGVELVVEQSILPQQEEIDMDSLTVLHLPEDENGNIVGVETVADMVGEVDGTVTAEDTVVEAVFEVNSFSYITIAYNNNYSRQLNLVDLSGNPIQILGYENDELLITTKGSQGDQNVSNPGAKYVPENRWISVETFVAQFGSLTEGYTYVEATLGAYNSGVRVKWIRYNNGYWYYSSNNAQPNQGQGGNRFSSRISLIYSKDAEVHQTGDLRITDAIPSSGTLNAEYTSTSGTPDGITYKWFKSEDGNWADDASKWTEVERKKITGSQYNVSPDGTSVNVALDDGARCFYRVRAYDAEGNVIATSETYQVPYYSSLQNGGFEDVKVNDISQNGSNYQFPNGTTGMVWQTTGSDNQIEIARPTSSSRPHNTWAYDGEQFAELNAEAAGALYQDVLTIPGSTMYWSLYHKARVAGTDNIKTDTMYVVAAPTSEVEKITTQDQLRDLVDQIKANPTYYTERGYYLRELSDDNRDWYHHTGSYPATSYLTRYFFVAGDTASGNNTVGNLLDNVSFTTDLPDVDPDHGNLIVTKTVSGLLDEDMKEYSLNIVVNGSDGKTYNYTFNESNFRPSDDGKTYTATWTLPNIPAGNSVRYTVTEEVPSKYETYYNWISTVNDTPGKSVSNITIPDQGASTVNFKNIYTTMEITVTKKVTGNMGDKTKKFGFIVTDAREKVTEFNLSDGESETISGLSVGSVIKLVESDNEGYDVSVRYGTLLDGVMSEDSIKIEPDEDKNYIITVQEGMTDILVTNDKTAIPDTGIFTDSKPYIMILSTVAVTIIGLAIMIFRKRQLLSD